MRDAGAYKQPGHKWRANNAVLWTTFEKFLSKLEQNDCKEIQYRTIYSYFSPILLFFKQQQGALITSLKRFQRLPKKRDKVLRRQCG